MKKTASPLRLAEKPNGSRLPEGSIDQKQLLVALTAFRRGDFSARLPDDWTVRTIVAIGHPTAAANKPKAAPGEARLPREETVFSERWPD